MTLVVAIATSTIGGTASDELRVAIPGGYVAAHTALGLGWHNDGSDRHCRVRADAGESWVTIQKEAAGNFTLVTNTYYCYFTFRFPVT
jgi:hypothetical protein